RVELARAFAALGEHENAAAEAHRAVDGFAELKAELDMARAQSLVDSLLRKAPAAGPSRDRGANGLTDREIEVLRLVAGGLSNQLIGERLFVSEHTVHRHLANIFSKLSVSSRAAAVAQAARRGIL